MSLWFDVFVLVVAALALLFSVKLKENFWERSRRYPRRFFSWPEASDIAMEEEKVKGSINLVLAVPDGECK